MTKRPELEIHSWGRHYKGRERGVLLALTIVQAKNVALALISLLAGYLGFRVWPL